MSASGYSRSAVWWRNHDSPRLQAFLALRIRTPSVCSSMSSQTKPQNVHVASFTTVKFIHHPAWGPARSAQLSLFLVRARPFDTAQTGRHDERSTKLPTAIAPPDAAWHIAPRLDHLPRRGIVFVILGHQTDDQLIRSVVKVHNRWFSVQLPP